MFKKKKTDDELVVERDRLEKEVRSLKDELATIKHQKKLEEEDIKHLVKIRQEQLEIEHQKKIQACEMEKQTAVASAKDEFRDKLEDMLKTQVKDIKEMYAQILKRLPDVNVRLKS